MFQQLNRHAATHAAATAVALLTSVSLIFGQTRIVAPENKYPVEEDVKAGREAAREVEQQLPILRDDGVDGYVERVGQRLVESIPSEFQHQQFRYSFEVVNVSDLNAFALPGGPMYINRGMIEAARTEGEVAGVLAHEISHVALRHGTAQAGKATKYEVGSVLGQIAGAVLGGTLGQVVSMGSQFGLGTAFMRFGREYERQADLLGAQILARAGYDPRDMASMFQTIQSKSGNGGPEWMSSHPNPSNRQQAITQEAAKLTVANPVRNTQAFTNVKTRLQRMSPAPTTEQAMKQSQGQGDRRTSQGGGQGGGQRGGQGGGGYPQDSRIGQVQPPSTRYQNYDEGNLFRVSVPENWRELPSNSSVTFAPEGGYGDHQGQSVFTHGMQMGVDQAGNSRNIQEATDALIDGLAQSNTRLRQASRYSNVNFAGRRGLTTVLTNVSDVTGGQERIALYTVQMADGNLFYVVGVAPSQEFSRYQNVFNQVVRSIQLNDNPRNTRY
ncbi:MAG: M48 family metalloprotease [Vicinamibacterales bacterium]